MTSVLKEYQHVTSTPSADVVKSLAPAGRLRALAGNMRAENIDEINGWLQH